MSTDAPGAVMGATTTVKTMADGTLRVAIDIDPRYAQSAFSLFGAPGTPVAIARIQPAAAVAADQKPADPPKGGEKAKLAGRWCQDPTFWTWLELAGFGPARNATDAAESVRHACLIRSRAEIDNDPAASERFDRLIRHPFMRWVKARTE